MKQKEENMRKVTKPIGKMAHKRGLILLFLVGRLGARQPGHISQPQAIGGVPNQMPS
jgi:hypothetical protein